MKPFPSNTITLEGPTKLELLFYSVILLYVCCTVWSEVIADFTGAK